MKATPPLVLASTSPRRRQLLESLGLSFSVAKPTSEEIHPDVQNVEKTTQENSMAKVESAVSKLKGTDFIGVGADTLVVLENEVLGKPQTKTDVVEMLMKLSGRTHRVVTGLSLFSPLYGRRSSAAVSDVTFRKISPREMGAYAELNEPYDKAGSYAVQGLSCLFIEKIEGSYTNVMGLPIELMLRELEKLTSVSIFEFFEAKRGDHR